MFGSLVIKGGASQGDYFEIDNTNSDVCQNKNYSWDFPGGAVVKNPPADAGDTVRSLVREHPTCRRATKPVCHNY